MTMAELERMRYLIDNLPDLGWDAEKALASATQITSHITGMPRGGGGNHQEDAAISYALSIEAYRKGFEELQGYRDRLIKLIKRLPDINDQGCMEARYIRGDRVKDIADKLKYHENSVYYHLTRGESEVTRMDESL